MVSDNQQQARFYKLLEPGLPRLQAFCLKLAGDADRGDDLLQDALYDAWRGFGRLRETTAFKPWLYRVVINRYRTTRKRLQKRADRTVPLSGEVADDRDARLRAARDRLNIAMAGLSASDRALVTLHELEGWPYPELAKTLGCREGALRTRLTRCRMKMREALRRHYERTSECTLKTGVAKRCAVVKQERN
jgi:RNA polymerase sigma-70 factor (ECF subfamily)